MKIGKCYICEASLSHFVKPVSAECNGCGKEEKTSIKCGNDHFLCHSCVSKKIMEILYEKIPEMTEKNPLDIAEKIFMECGVSGNTPHPILAGAFLTAFKNTTGSITHNDVLEGIERAGKIPGDWNGYYGTHGAAVALGICFSVIKKTTPIHDKEKNLANFATAFGLQAAADQGRPKCCVRAVRDVLAEGINLAKIHLGIEFPEKKINFEKCFFSTFQPECKKEKCSFYEIKNKGGVTLDLTIVEAKRSEIKNVEDVLNQCNLSTAGLKEHIDNFYLAKSDNRVVGCIGLEIYGKYGVIRSTAVLPRHRKKGIGAKLAENMFDFAKDRGIAQLYLKTEKEEKFFSAVGFKHILPGQIPAEIKDTEMLAQSCCGSKAAAMVMDLQQAQQAGVEAGVIDNVVKDKYAGLAKAFSSSSDSSSCCGSKSSQKSAVTRDLYENLPDDIPVEALAASLGCGNPTLLAQIDEGEVVLDLGSGGGLDVFLSAKRTGPGGKVYGLDMTDEMLELARENQRKAGIENVEFLKGHMENVPLPANSVDLIISNCVVNLSANKDKVLSEAFRVLKPAGRLAISDIVFLKKVPPKLKKNMDAWSGCIAGALERDEYITKLKETGFEDVDIQITRTYELKDFEKYPAFKDLGNVDRKHLEGAMTASFVRAKKPKKLKPVALISTYEVGFQPLLLSTAGAAFINAGIIPDAYDLYLDKSGKSGIENHSFIGIGLALFDSLEGSVAIAKEIRGKNPDAHICFYGPYAGLNKERMLQYGDSCILGDWEKPIVQLARAVLDGNDWTEIPQVYSEKNKSVAFKFDRKESVVPARHLLPPVKTYTNTFIENIVNKKMIVGNVETTRGCHHKCKFCSVYAVSGLKVKFVGEDIVMADVDQLVKDEVGHLTFVDAEFINDIRYTLAIVNKIHEKYPYLTYDFTTRIDHIVEHEEAIPEFKRTGCIAITTSIEFPRADILSKLEKDITLNDIVKAMGILKASGIQVNTTFVTFNPWTDLEGLMELANFIKVNKLEDVIDPIQFETRLHLYKGSPLLKDKALSGIKLNEQDFHYEWEHPDAQVDEVFNKMVKPAEEGEFKRCCLRC